MAKLTLNVNPSVIARAKQYAKSRNVSVSSIVESYLSAVTEPVAQAVREDLSILRALRGSLKKGNVAEYKRYLGKKFI